MRIIMRRADFRWLLPALTALGLALGLAFPAMTAEPPVKTAPARDWAKHPAIAEVDTSEDIYALGDVHGDYERLISLLLKNKLILADPAQPEKIEWTGGKAVLVCTGDMIDKGDQSYQVLLALRALRTSAAKGGGQVILVSGNHEAEFIAGGGQNKKAVEFIKELKARDIKPEDVAAGKDTDGIGEMLRTLPFAARVNDWFFAHAGNTHGRTLAKLREDLEKGIDKDGFKAEVLQDPNSLLLARSLVAPWWEKEDDKEGAPEERLRGNLKALGVKHLVVGHVPGKVSFADKTSRPAGALYQKYDGTIFFVDVGMSRAVAYSSGALLHISGEKHERAEILLNDGTKRELWSK